MLKSKLQNQIKEYIIKNNIDDKLNIKNLDIKFLAQGEYNINFNINDEYVFRVNTKSQLELDNQIKYEYDALDRLKNSGVTPKPIYLDDSLSYFDYGILIMEFLKGSPLEYNKDIKKAGNIFGEIHNIDLNSIDTSNFIVENNILTDRINEGNRWLKDFMNDDYINKDIKNIFYDLLNYCEKNKHNEKYFIDNKCHVINNTEVNSHNFIIGEKSYLIDWEKPVISDPCQDITQFLAPTTTLWKQNYLLSKEEIKDFYKEYKSHFDKDINIEQRVEMYNPYLYLRALSWCASAYLEYKNVNKDIRNIDTYEKIKEYLDADFMKELLNDYI